MKPGDASAFAFNILSSVLVVFVNKSLLGDAHGFSFATTLCGLHFLCSGACTWAAQALGFGKRPGAIPWRDVLLYALVANLSIASLNLSLLVNSVGFYQIAKLGIIPCVGGLEAALDKKPVTLPVAASIFTVVAGVAIVTVTDVQLNLLGLAIAVVSVLSSSAQQVVCGRLQRRFALSSNQLLSSTAHIQGLMLLVIGPKIDLLVSSRWVADYAWSAPALRQLALSCALAVLVNISQFMCLGRFSAVAFQVLGHMKTMIVLLASWWVFGERMNSRKVAGMALAVLGMVMYGVVMKSAAAAPAATQHGAKQQQATRRRRRQLPAKQVSPFEAVQAVAGAGSDAEGDDTIKAVGVLPEAAAAIVSAVDATALKQRLRPRSNTGSRHQASSAATGVQSFPISLSQAG